jgi:hypothetical protein
MLHHSWPIALQSALEAGPAVTSLHSVFPCHVHTALGVLCASVPTDCSSAGLLAAVPLTVCVLQQQVQHCCSIHCCQQRSPMCLQPPLQLCTRHGTHAGAAGASAAASRHEHTRLVSNQLLAGDWLASCE